MNQQIDIASKRLLVSKNNFRTLILEWYRLNRRKLPWRNTSDPYRIWISEIMLQQTQVKTVIPYYRRFIRRFPTVKKLAAADIQDVLTVWQGLGYYRRAIHLHEAAGLIVTDHHGKLPESYEQLSNLPGFGDYTTGAVLSIAFNQAYPAIDGNVNRIFSRLLAPDPSVTKDQFRMVLRQLVKSLIPVDNPSDFNQSLMELGALICTPKNPDCGNCPVRRMCRAAKYYNPTDFPAKNEKIINEVRPVAIAVIYHRGRFLIARRPPQGLLPNLWEFPGGKILPGETPENACIREVKEETGLEIKIHNLITRFTHHYSHYSVDLHFYKCRFISGKISSKSNVPILWVSKDEMALLPFPRSTQRVIKMLKEFFP